MIADKKRLSSKLESENIDALIAVSLKNVYYTSGIWITSTVTPGAENYLQTGLYTDYAPPKAISICSPSLEEPRVVVPPVITTDIVDQGIDLSDEQVFIYGEQVIGPDEKASPTTEQQELLNLFQSHKHPNRVEAIAAALEPVLEKDSTVALESCGIFGEYTSFVRDAIKDRFDVGRIIEADRIFQELRVKKTEEEIDRLRKAAEINRNAIYETLEHVEDGMTEQEFANLYKQNVYGKGAIEQLGFYHTMVAFGPHTAFPHVMPGDRQLSEGDLMRIEVGCRYKNYPADTCIAAAYKSASDLKKNRYKVVYTGMERCRELLAEHVTTKEVHRGTIDAIREKAHELDVARLKDFESHMIGHNLGLDVHDPPILSPREEPIEPGMVMNYEVYDADWDEGAIQLEDTVLITENGVEPLTTSPEELLIVE